MKKTALLLITSHFIFWPILGMAEENSEIEMVYLKNGCPNCHGFYGQGTSSGPRLQYKKEELLLRRLRDLQKGITRIPGGTIMVPFAKSLDVNQTKAMAHYLSIIKTSYENQDEYDYDGDDFGDS